MAKQDKRFCYKNLAMNKAIFKSLRRKIFFSFIGINLCCDDEACLTR